jgi:hypothetical protein
LISDYSDKNNSCYCNDSNVDDDKIVVLLVDIDVLDIH